MSEVQTTPRLSLFAIESELLGLIDQREDALERLAAATASPELPGVENYTPAITEELAVVDGLIRDYLKREVKKVDSIAFCVKEFEARAEARKAEAERMKASADRDAETAKRIKEMVLQVMQEFGEKKLPGRLFTITRQGNGGVQALTIAQPDLVPDAFKRVLVSMPLIFWAELTAQRPGLTSAATINRLEPNTEAIRESLLNDQGVMGCKLEERGEHIRIK